MILSEFKFFISLFQTDGVEDKKQRFPLLDVPEIFVLRSKHLLPWLTTNYRFQSSLEGVIIGGYRNIYYTLLLLPLYFSPCYKSPRSAAHTCAWGKGRFGPSAPSAVVNLHPAVPRRKIQNEIILVYNAQKCIKTYKNTKNSAVLLFKFCRIIPLFGTFWC